MLNLGVIVYCQHGFSGLGDLAGEGEGGLKVKS